MSYQRERDSFMRAIGQTLSEYQLTNVLRLTSTLHRLAEAQCNGDWPADNGQRDTATCPKCELGWAPSSMRGTKGNKVCPDCYATGRLVALLKDSRWMPVFNGDPRGSVVSLYPLGTDRDAIDRGAVRGIPVPVRYR